MSDQVCGLRVRNESFPTDLQKLTTPKFGSFLYAESKTGKIIEVGFISKIIENIKGAFGFKNRTSSEVLGKRLFKIIQNLQKNEIHITETRLNILKSIAKRAHVFESTKAEGTPVVQKLRAFERKITEMKLQKNDLQKVKQENTPVAVSKPVNQEKPAQVVAPQSEIVASTSLSSKKEDTTEKQETSVEVQEVEVVTAEISMKVGQSPSIEEQKPSSKATSAQSQVVSLPTSTSESSQECALSEINSSKESEVVENESETVQDQPSVQINSASSEDVQVTSETADTAESTKINDSSSEAQISVHSQAAETISEEVQVEVLEDQDVPASQSNSSTSSLKELAETISEEIENSSESVSETSSEELAEIPTEDIPEEKDPYSTALKITQFLLGAAFVVAGAAVVWARRSDSDLSNLEDTCPLDGHDLGKFCALDEKELAVKTNFSPLNLETMSPLTPKELSGFSSIDDNPLGVCVSGPVFQNLNPDQMSQNIAAKAAEASERLFNTLLEKTKKEGRVSSLLEAEKAAVNLGKPFDELEETWLAVRALQGKHQNILDNPIYQKYLRDSKIPAEVIQKWIGKDKFDFEDSMTLAKKTGGYFFIQRAEALAPKLGLSFSELESGWLTVKSNQERIAAKAKRGNKNYVEVLKNSSIPEEKKTQWIRDYEASYAYKKPQPRPVQGPQPRPQEDVQGLEIDAQAAINKMMNSQFLNRAPQ